MAWSQLAYTQGRIFELDLLRGFRSSVIVKGGGKMLRVIWNTELLTSDGILTFHTSMRSVVTGGIVSTVVCTMRSYPVEVET